MKTKRITALLTALLLVVFPVVGKTTELPNDMYKLDVSAYLVDKNGMPVKDPTVAVAVRVEVTVLRDLFRRTIPVTWPGGPQFMPPQEPEPPDQIAICVYEEGREEKPLACSKPEDVQFLHALPGTYAVTYKVLDFKPAYRFPAPDGGPPFLVVKAFLKSQWSIPEVATQGLGWLIASMKVRDPRQVLIARM